MFNYSPTMLACAVGYAHKRRIEQYTYCAHIMDVAVRQLVAVSTLLFKKKFKLK
jgi:hypothetical protein